MYILNKYSTPYMKKTQSNHERQGVCICDTDVSSFNFDFLVLYKSIFEITIDLQNWVYQQ